MSKTLVTNSFNKFFVNHGIKSIEALTPDASSRRYYRVFLDSSYQNKYDSILAMHFTDLSASECGNNTTAVNTAVKELGEFFLEQEVKVPKIFFTDEDIYFIEDLGDALLAEHYQEHKDLSKYKEAIDQIFKIQNINSNKEICAFNREFDYKIYRTELDEIIDYTLGSLNIKPVEKKALEQDFKILCEEIVNFEKVLVHRDYHSWNIIVDQQNKLRIIDYQDALLATKYYDFVALINDRDTDQLLGDDNYFELVKYFYNKFNQPNNFLIDYSKVLLQRDLKVVGRFSKLDQQKNIDHYSKWIPGTLRRIYSTLSFLSPQYQNTLEIITKYFPKYLVDVETRKVFTQDLK